MSLHVAINVKIRPALYLDDVTLPFCRGGFAWPSTLPLLFSCRAISWLGSGELFGPGGQSPLLSRDVQFSYKNRSSSWRVHSCQSTIPLSAGTANDSWWVRATSAAGECQLWHSPSNMPRAVKGNRRRHSDWFDLRSAQITAMINLHFCAAL